MVNDALKHFGFLTSTQTKCWRNKSYGSFKTAKDEKRAKGSATAKSKKRKNQT
jgi:hypothetical protein